MANRVWIELEFPDNDEQGKERAALASHMLQRLGVTVPNPVFWLEKKQAYCFTKSDDGCFVEASDHGQWYDLDYLGREK